MDLIRYVQIIGGAAVLSLVLALMTAFSPRRRLWMSEAALERRRSLPYILVSWAIGWVLLAAGGIYLMHYIASFSN